MTHSGLFISRTTIWLAAWLSKKPRDFDINNVPLWDTWVAFFQDQQPNIDSFDTEYLIAWVPPEFVDVATEGISVNPEECIRWLSDTSVELAKALQAENLLA